MSQSAMIEFPHLQAKRRFVMPAKKREFEAINLIQPLLVFGGEFR